MQYMINKSDVAEVNATGKNFIQCRNAEQFGFTTGHTSLKGITKEIDARFQKIS